jgi:hypothetical protein
MMAELAYIKLKHFAQKYFIQFSRWRHQTEGKYRMKIRLTMLLDMLQQNKIACKYFGIPQTTLKDMQSKGDFDQLKNIELKCEKEQSST